MTELQVKYQQLQEQKRANLAQESLKGQDISVKSKEADIREKEYLLDEMKVPAQITDLLSHADLNVKQTAKLGQEISNLQEEVNLIRARTDLTNEQKEHEIVNTTYDRAQTWAYTSGFGLIDQVIGAFLKMIGGAGKSLIG